jgi:hypothetical protein
MTRVRVQCSNYMTRTSPIPTPENVQAGGCHRCENVRPQVDPCERTNSSLMHDGNTKP